ncbi:hypothetical protein GCM10010399_82730 [Dactylosporangium fulvum]|uniref:Uncharacterized protein n=1 Tax=Dactylosporangium fulvum TaxID=53359 RepID=A0ABY5WCJ3_9ACTN|nr:hypothetical protein [Dactylosporangium fulvum]UWP85856.1 hypothetical protein Dfulv_17055 [Dactylosporangium fulvum]
MNALDGPNVRGPHVDGTYSIVSDIPGDGAWVLRDTGAGWEATHPRDGWLHLPGGVPCRWATAEDAAQAVLGDPADTLLVDGRRYWQVFQ